MFVEPRIAKLLEKARNHPDLPWLAGLVEGEGSFFPGSPSAPGSAEPTGICAARAEGDEACSGEGCRTR
jgi:hypothetical protein